MDATIRIDEEDLEQEESGMNTAVDLHTVNLDEVAQGSESATREKRTKDGRGYLLLKYTERYIAALKDWATIGNKYSQRDGNQQQIRGNACSKLSTILGIGIQRRVAAFLAVFLLILSAILPGEASCEDQLQALAVSCPYITRLPLLRVDRTPTNSCCQFFLSTYDLHTTGCLCGYLLGETVGLQIDSLRLLSLDFFCPSSNSLRRICAVAQPPADIAPPPAADIAPPAVTEGAVTSPPLDIDDSLHPVRGQAIHHDWKQIAWIACMTILVMVVVCLLVLYFYSRYGSSSVDRHPHWKIC